MESWYGNLKIVQEFLFLPMPNLFLNVFTFGATTVFSGKSFHTFTTLIGKHSFLIFRFAPTWNNFKQCPLVPSRSILWSACNFSRFENSHNISHIIVCTSQTCLHVFFYIGLRGLAARVVYEVYIRGCIRGLFNLSYLEAASWPCTLSIAMTFLFVYMGTIYMMHIAGAYCRCDLTKVL